MPKETRVDRAEYMKRIDAVLRIRLDGAQFHDVFQFVAEKGWNLSERQVRNYMRAADNLLAEHQQTSRRRIIALHIGRREALYARAVNAADYRTALAVASDLAKLQGVYALAEEAAEQGRRGEQTLQPRLTPEEAKRIAREAAAEARAAEPDWKEIVLVPPTE
jgi:hypothetical protein